jgi:serine/threonine protein kinase
MTLSQRNHFKTLLNYICFIAGLTFGVSSVIVAILTTVIKLERSKRKELFRKNGGKALQDVTGLVIFTKEELRKITDNDSNFLGKGRFGNVYKGTLRDNTVVAVKASIKVSKETKDEFTEEVKIQSKMIHKNILKLIGCCLEVDVPKLVYEFAANGSLEDTLYRRKRPLSLNLRLDIAIGSAEGLKYMHSDAPLVIRHGDIKPGNILLDENFTPKISDFGLSKLLTLEYCIADSVVGPFAYIDPVYRKTGLLTQKSDVYSFGAVLVELVTREQNDNGQERIKRFCRLYAEEGSAQAMFDKEIETDEDIFMLEQIGKLATECLEEDTHNRPYMTEVVERLVMLRRRRKHGITQDRSDPEDTITHGSESTSASVLVPSTPDCYRPT